MFSEATLTTAPPQSQTLEESDRDKEGRNTAGSEPQQAESRLHLLPRCFPSCPRGPCLPKPTDLSQYCPFAHRSTGSCCKFPLCVFICGGPGMLEISPLYTPTMHRQEQGWGEMGVFSSWCIFPTSIAVVRGSSKYIPGQKVLEGLPSSGRTGSPGLEVGGGRGRSGNWEPPICTEGWLGSTLRQEPHPEEGLKHRPEEELLWFQCPGVSSHTHWVLLFLG